MMIKKTLMIIALPLLILNSSCKEDRSSDNLLIAEEVTASCVSVLDNFENPDWMDSFNSLEFFKAVFNTAKTGKLTIRGGYSFEDKINSEIYSAKDIDRQMRAHVDTFDLNLIKEIRFLEKWNLDNKTLKFTKVVTAWTPIKVWEENGKTRKQMVFFTYPEKTEKGGLIAENIIYEHPWHQEYPNLYTGFDQLKFLQRVIDGVKNGSLKVYDPIYLVDRTMREFNAKQLEEYIDIELKPLLLNDYITSILFEEDWYFNKNTLEITKEVKSFALIKGDYKTEDYKKSIMFFIIPN